MKTTRPVSPPTEAPSSAPAAHVDLPMQPVGGSPLLKDMTGQRFGRLTVISRAENTARGLARWNVRCDCGALRIVSGSNLRTGTTKSCECLRNKPSSRRVNHVGKHIGRLTILARARNGERGQTRWKVQCDCGTIKTILNSNLPRTTSCGCFAREQSAKRIGANHNNWDPTLTQEDRDRHRLGSPAHTEFKVLAQQIRRRDRATCLVCGAPNSTHVHHLQPWAAYRDLRYDPANLVTLCKECHNQFHALYGKDADLDDFEEFLC